MELLPGIRLQSLVTTDESWNPAARLALASGTEGVRLDRMEGPAHRNICFYPREDWRAPTEQELSRLLRTPTPHSHLSFTHISLLTEVLTVINLAAIFHNTVHLFEL